MAKKLLTVTSVAIGVAFVAILLALLPQTASVEALSITDTPGGGPTLTPSSTPWPTATAIPGVLPAFGISIEKYDPSDGSNTTTFQAQYDRPYSITVLSYNPPPEMPTYIGFNGDVPTELFWITNFKGWKWLVFDYQWSNPETLPPNYTPSHIIFNIWDFENEMGLGWCQPQGRPYTGPTFTAVLTDTSVGPTLVFKNETEIVLDHISWGEYHASGSDGVRADFNIQPGQIITGPTNLWWGYFSSECWSGSWDFARWKPTPTATPTASPTMAPPTVTPTMTPTYFPTTTPTLLPTFTPGPTVPSAPTDLPCVGSCQQPPPTPVDCNINKCIYLPLVMKAP